MKPRQHAWVPVSAEEALSRIEGGTTTNRGILLSAAPDFYTPDEVPPDQRASQRLVHAERAGGELHLTLPASGKGQRELNTADQVWLLASAARTLCRLGIAGDVPCRVALHPAVEAGATYHIANVHGRPIDLDQAVVLDELRGLNAVRDWAPPPLRTVAGGHDLFIPRMVSEEEALPIVNGQQPGLQLAVSSHGQYAAVAENNRASPFVASSLLAMISPMGGLNPGEASLLLEVPAPEEVETLAWRLRCVAQRLIAIGASASARCMVSVDKGDLLLDPSHRILDHNEQPFQSVRMYRLSEVRGFRDVEDLPTLKRPPQERILDAEPVVAGEYTLEQALREAARCVQCGLCRDVCPNGVGLASYVDPLKRGDLNGAARHLRELNPGVDLTCQVCPAPCQTLCILAHEEIPRRPVDIRGIERVLAQQPAPPGVSAPGATGYKVALVGLGPANVVAAARLAREGHEVHVLERETEFGGAVSLIPSFRVRQARTRDWIKQLLQDTGVIIHTGVTLGKDLAFEDLRKNFNAVILGIGSGQPLQLGIEGEEFGGVTNALDVLRKFNKAAAGEPGDQAPPKLRNTIVIGGGDVAADVTMWYVRTAAQSARRVIEAARAGASRAPEVANVVWTYRRGRADMPVSPEVLADAEDEINALLEYQSQAGIAAADGELPSGVYFHLRPVKVLGEQGRVCGMQFIRTRHGEKRDHRGRRGVEDIPGSEFTIPADAVVVLAVGQRPDPAALRNLPGVVLDANGRVQVDESMRAAEGIYAVGDLVGGEILADAISHGRRAADAVHQQYLAGLAGAG